MDFRISGVTKREKSFFQKKISSLFDKLIIKNVQNELLYNNVPSDLGVTLRVISFETRFLVFLNPDSATLSFIIGLADKNVFL